MQVVQGEAGRLRDKILGHELIERSGYVEIRSLSPPPKFCLNFIKYLKENSRWKKLSQPCYLFFHDTITFKKQINYGNYLTRVSQINLTINEQNKFCFQSVSNTPCENFKDQRPLCQICFKLIDEGNHKKCLEGED